jgi:hypothetical protein
MRMLFSATCALALMGSAAIADEVIVKPAPGVIIENRAADENTTTTKTVRHGDGCTTRSMTRTNDATDTSVTRTQTNC